MVYDSVPPGYDVEFADRDGVTVALLTLRDDDLELGREDDAVQRATQ